MKIRRIATPAAITIAAALALTACITPAANNAAPVDLVTDTVVVTGTPELAETSDETVAVEVTTTPAAANGESRFSMDAMTVPTTFDEHLQFLADNLRKYNEIAPSLWKENAVTDLFAIAKNTQTGDFYLVSSNGEHQPITREEAIERGLDEESEDLGYHHIPNSPANADAGNVGFFIELNLDELNDWEDRAPGFAPMLPFRAGVHETFHVAEQSALWADPFQEAYDFETNEMLVSEEEFAELLTSINADREEFLENTDARVARRLLMRDLRLAVENPDNEDYVLQALATYRDFKEKFPEQHDIARNQDRGEGTAAYFDAVAALRVLFPEIETKQDLDAALAHWVGQREYEDMLTTGLVLEGYYVGMLSSILVDRYVDTPVWQQAVMDDYNATPLSVLNDHFADRELPAPSVADQAFIDRTVELIEQREAGFTDSATPTVS